jgi:hypothetical protein
MKWSRSRIVGIAVALGLLLPAGVGVAVRLVFVVLGRPPIFWWSAYWITALTPGFAVPFLAYAAWAAHLHPRRLERSALGAFFVHELLDTVLIGITTALTLALVWIFSSERGVEVLLAPFYPVVIALIGAATGAVLAILILLVASRRRTGQHWQPQV